MAKVAKKIPENENRGSQIHNLSLIYLYEIKEKGSTVIYLRPRRRRRIVFGIYSGGKYGQRHF